MNASDPISQTEWNLSGLTQYMLTAIQETSRVLAPLDQIQSNACMLLMEDIYEFGSAVVGSGAAGFWSVANATLRSLIERIDVLTAAAMDPAAAKRYLDSVVAGTKAGSLHKLKKRQRSEDSFDSLHRHSALETDDVKEFRELRNEQKNMLSDLFVHPTPFGPLLSRSVRDESTTADEQWWPVMHVVVAGCLWSLTAAHNCGVAAPVELVRSIDGAANASEAKDPQIAASLRDIHSHIAGLVQSVGLT